MARGRLTRDWDEATARSETDEFGSALYAATAAADKKVVERVAEIAARRGVPRAQIALAWVLAKPVITAPIYGFEAATPYRRSRRPVARPQRRRKALARGALCAARGRRIFPEREFRNSLSRAFLMRDTSSSAPPDGR